jgi:hypothetical protein
MPFTTQFKSFNGTDCWCNWMEVVDRFACYGVKALLPGGVGFQPLASSEWMAAFIQPQA